MKHLRLRARFLFVLIILLVAMFTAITLVIVRENTKTLRADLVNQSKSFAALATEPIGGTFLIYKDSGTDRIRGEVTNFTSLDRDINQVEVVDTGGNLQFTDTPGSRITVSAEAASSVEATNIYDKAGHLTAIVEPYLESFGIHRYAVVYGISYASVNQNIHEVVTLIVSLSTFILLLSLVVWYLLINRLFIRPVASISQDALRISKGDLAHKMHLGRSDEIGDLAAAVDTMANSLEADIAKLKELDRLKSEFLMITSHNLRTPLTVIEGYISLMRASEELTKIHDLLEPIAMNVMRLKGFAEDVLTISTIETGQVSLSRKPLEMKPLMDRVAEEFAMMAKQKKLQFTSSVDTNAWVNLDKSHFHSAIWNLLDNAFKFTPEAGTVELHVATVGDELEIKVTDSGIGISAAEIPQLFTKFHRGTDTMTYDYEGTGIGLYISKIIMEQHGGSIKVESVKDKGSTFTLVLPTVPPPSVKPGI